MGRKDWSPGSEEGVERVFTDRPYTTMVLPRDKLTGALYAEINKRYGEESVKFNFGVEVRQRKERSDELAKPYLFPQTAHIRTSVTSHASSITRQ